MIVVLVVAAILLGSAVALVARALGMPRARMAENLGQIQGYGFAVPRAEAGGGAVGTIVGEIANIVGGMFSSRFGKAHEAEIRTELLGAGLYSTTPRKFNGYRILCAVCVPAAWFWVAPAVGFSKPLAVLGAAGAVYVGWAAPLVVLRKRARRRFEVIDYDLPELIDLLIVTMEAGLGFVGSLKLASERLHGPLAEEIQLMLQEQSMGLATTEALQHMLVRCETPAMRSFVRSVIQGESLGVSTGQIMRNLATEMRKRRRDAANERAQKAPVKILFPLIFLIFPAMFVILLGPAIFSFLEAFRNV